MERKHFIRNILMGSLTAPFAKSKKRKDKNGISNTALERVGYNHIKKENKKIMKYTIHPADTRGKANHGWLQSHHSFSFANYYNPDRMNFGALRVLNDDQVAPGRGFGTHPHDNMEIISIPLSGDLEHKDSMGNTTIIREGDIQIMSAGTGVSHSEYNKNRDKEVAFLQIWLFPNAQNVTPRYDQISIQSLLKKNEFSQILSPNADDAGVWIHQDAWFSMGEFDTDKEITYQLNKPDNNGVYLFVLKGNINIDGKSLSTRDGFGAWDMDLLKIDVEKGSKVLLMEVPMNIA